MAGEAPQLSRPFFTFSHTKSDYRVSSLLSRLGVKDRLYQQGETPVRDIFDIDFSSYEENFSKQRLLSFDYLNKALGKAIMNDISC